MNIKYCGNHMGYLCMVTIVSGLNPCDKISTAEKLYSEHIKCISLKMYLDCFITNEFKVSL